jgi:threonine synthase
VREFVRGLLNRLIYVRRPENTVQVILATAHPAKFSDAVEQALSSQPAFNFQQQVLPDEFKGLMEKERKVVSVDGIEIEKTKRVIDESLKALFGSAVTAGEGPAV